MSRASLNRVRGGDAVKMGTGLMRLIFNHNVLDATEIVLKLTFFFVQTKNNARSCYVTKRVGQIVLFLEF